MPKTEEINEHANTLTEHLVELRVRLMHSIYSILAMTALVYYKSELIFDVIRTPILKYLPSGGLIYTGPMDKFLAHLKISIFCGVALSCPFWLYQIWKFLAPGLYAKEKKYTSYFIFVGTGLFATGILFAYFLVLPATFEFLMSFGGDIDKPMISIESYLSFVAQICFVFGLSFELPLILVILGLLDIINKDFLKKQRRFAYLGLSVASAILTPQPDALSMLIMLIPMMLLYEVAILFVKK